MCRVAAILSLFLAAPALAEEEDDPAFSRQRSGGEPAEVDEPMPDPIPYTDEDPGLAGPTPAAAPAKAPAVAKRPRRPPPDEDPGDIGIGFRIGYRTLVIPEVSGPPRDGFMQDFKDDRFHGLTIDVYPISWYTRIGLSTQVAVETGDSDWLATEGLTVGLQRPSGRVTPFVEGGVHVGLARRTMWLFDDAVGPHDFVTLLWAFGLEGGIDARLGGRTLGTLAIGIQRTSFFYSSGNVDDKLLIKNDLGVALKLGIGY